MLSLIIVSLVAGVCFGQDASKYADCDTVDTIASDCSAAHLEYVEKLDEGIHTDMQTLANLHIPEFLLPRLLVICNNPLELEKYYLCAFDNLTTCLQEKQSTKQNDLPGVRAISMGVVDLCKVDKEINKTCIKDMMMDVTKCIDEAIQAKGQAMSDPCSFMPDMLTCVETLMDCDGGEAIKEFMISARPHSCPNPSSASKYLPSFLTILMAMLLAHFSNFQ